MYYIILIAIEDSSNYRLGFTEWANLKLRVSKAFGGEKQGMTEETTFASIIEAGKSWRQEDKEMQSDLNEDNRWPDHNGTFP